jgi:adenosylhomocysteine nucleosidase
MDKMNVDSNQIVVMISANTEWKAVKQYWNVKEDDLHTSPLGEWFLKNVNVHDQICSVVFFHGGWGKISAAASTQYVIDHWEPGLLVNLGTCGGFRGCVDLGEIILVDRTLVYDILEQMGDNQAAINHYSVDLDLSWIVEPYPMQVRRTLLVSGDRDLIPEEIIELHQRYSAVAGDWESGAIAFVAKKNNLRILILRGVSDLVSSNQGEAYVEGGHAIFQQRAADIMARLLVALPEWLAYVS